MKRKFLFAMYETPRGRLLQTMEAGFLRRSITVGCKQSQLQVGGLGWEPEFVDCSLYQNYVILDDKTLGCEAALRVQGKAFRLPIQTESMDLVILPHLLEFDAQRFQTMREVHRVLKPGGELIMLNFNPLSLYVRMQFLWSRSFTDSWRAHFIYRHRVNDWLKLLNFELLTTAEFGLDRFHLACGGFTFNSASLFAIAYGVKAVKRQYSLISLTPSRPTVPKLATLAGSVKSSVHHRHD
jgi:SAM-dependent methyltransferase